MLQACVTDAGVQLTQCSSCRVLYQNGTLASYVAYQALNLVALQADAISFNTTCPGEKRSLSQQFASLRLFQVHSSLLHCHSCPSFNAQSSAISCAIHFPLMMCSTHGLFQQDSVRTANYQAQYLAKTSFEARRTLFVYSEDAVFQPYKAASVTTPPDDNQGFPQGVLDRFKRGNLDPTLFKYLPTGCDVGKEDGRQYLQVLANDKLAPATFDGDPLLSRVRARPVYGTYNPDGIYTGTWAWQEGLTYFDDIPNECQPVGFRVALLGATVDAFIADLSASCKEAIKRHWKYTCSYCSDSGKPSPPYGPDPNGGKPASSNVHTNGVSGLSSHGSELLCV